MQDYNIEVGDRVTLKYRNENREYQWLMTCKSDIETALEDNKEILKIERIGTNGWYTVYEKEKELLTEDERELLKAYIKWIRSLNNGEIANIYKINNWITLNLKTGLDYTIEIGTRFYNLVENKRYTLSELGLEN